MNVICVLKTGGIYKPLDVEKLYGMVGRNTDLDRFVCLTDDKTLNIPGVETVSLHHKWPGWWSKIELFRTHIFKQGDRVYYFDLDTIIVDSLHDISLIEDRWVILNDFYRDQRYGSGMMSWIADDYQHIYRDFAREPYKAMGSSPRGDQDWIERVAPHATFWQDVVPGQVVSYKVHCQGGLPEDTRVVCFHGRPKPSEVNADWVRENWTV